MVEGSRYVEFADSPLLTEQVPHAAQDHQTKYDCGKGYLHNIDGKVSGMESP